MRLRHNTPNPLQTSGLVNILGFILLQVNDFCWATAHSGGVYAQQLTYRGCKYRLACLRVPLRAPSSTCSSVHLAQRPWKVNGDVKGQVVGISTLAAQTLQGAAQTVWVCGPVRQNSNPTKHPPPSRTSPYKSYIITSQWFIWGTWRTWRAV